MARGGRTEADTCRTYVLPAVQESGWLPDQIVDQYRITDGRVVLLGRRPRREEQLRADYVLEVSAGFPVAVIEAKREYGKPEDGLPQAKEYAELLDLPMALATNGRGIVEFDVRTGQERPVTRFPRPDEAWERYLAWRGIADDTVAQILREPFNRTLRNVDGTVKEPRYYQRIAIHRAVAAILSGDRRLLLTMATGTGKTFTALQIAWKVWRYWQRKGESGTRRVLYLADRDALVEQPLKKDFRPVFEDAAGRILGESPMSRNILFSTYQALRHGSGVPRYRDYPPDYFDLIVVDECHRGSARDESEWREILEHFTSATQLGLTATPKRDDNVDTYRYFRNPIYSYSLAKGIRDGFLAPYRVRRVMLSPDAHGWRPRPDEIDRYGREIPDKLYTTSEFERIVSLLARTEAAARYLTDYLKATNRMAKMAIFCVDAEHAALMRRAMGNANADLGAHHPEYAVRIVADDQERGKAMLERFQDEETSTPVVVTTARLLSTGIDIPTLQTIVLFKPVRSMVEFKQIIGRGSRLAPDFDKLSFDIIDFTRATLLFEDPEFDGPADLEVDDLIDEEGQVVEEVEASEMEPVEDDQVVADGEVGPPPDARKYYVDDVEVYLTADSLWMTDPETDRLRLVEYREHVANSVRHIAPTPAGLRRRWRNAAHRTEIWEELRRRAINRDELLDRVGLPEADAFDILVHLAWNEPVLTRLERARRVRRDHAAFFARFQSGAREVLDLLLERYAQHGVDDMADMHVLRLEPFEEIGGPQEFADRFGGGERLRKAVSELERLLYVA
jgi:type I restriction enzyme, R subunit